MADAPPEDRRCDYCRLRLGVNPVQVDRDGETYRYCCRACRETAGRQDRPYAEYRGGTRISPGVDPLDDRLPEGLPRNAFVLLSAQTGTRVSSLLAELVWRTLQRDEPVVAVCFHEPPLAAVERCLALDWNVQPALESGSLGFVDAFSARLGDDGLRDRLTDWNRHLMGLIDPVSDRVRDPTDVGELESKLDAAMTDRSMIDRGLVTIDSLTELGSRVQPVHAYEYVRDLRADACKGRFVPVIAPASYVGDQDVFPHDLEYLADGVVDLDQSGAVVEDRLVKRLRVRKMEDVPSSTTWGYYDVRPGTGLVELAIEPEGSEGDDDAG